jgi:hypothetical protein
MRRFGVKHGVHLGGIIRSLSIYRSEQDEVHYDATSQIRFRPSQLFHWC